MEKPMFSHNDGYTVRQLFFMNEVSDFHTLLDSGLACCKGGRWKPSVQSFEMTLLRQTAKNKYELDYGTYTPYKTNNFWLCERGKWRLIQAHKIKDRQVYKSFCDKVLKPEMEGRIIENNSASQVNKGTECSIKQFRQGLAKATRKWGNGFYVVTFDFHNYFGSIPHENLRETIVLNDSFSMWLLSQYIDLFPGDCGIGIGGEPSQVISIVYPSKLDRMLQCEPKVIASGRYMDDGYAICHTKEDARYVLKLIRKCADELNLIINDKRTKISWMRKESVVWLKKRTTVTDTGKIIMELSRKNVRDELRRIDYQKKKIDRGEMPQIVAEISIECWFAYAIKFDSYKQMLRVANHYMDTFNVPWDKMKILFKRRHSGWIEKKS